MERVTPEQIAQAKKIDLFSYLEKIDPDELVHVSGQEYCTRTHDSLRISRDMGLWNWCSRGFGGKTALDYLIKVKGMKFVDAVKHLCGNTMSYVPSEPEKTPQKRAEKKPFILPSANFTNNVIFDYLCNKRGLSKELVRACIAKGLIYESRNHHNVVFVGCDKNKIPRYATVRGCSEKQFRHDVEGSDKAYAFSIPSLKPSAALYVFESAIDALSFSVLKGVSGAAHLLALSGVAPPQSSGRKMRKLPVALERYLQEHPEIRHIGICLDNDEPGRRATQEIMRLLQDQYTVYDMPPKEGKDFNDQLLAARARSRGNKDYCR